jgi:probable HAF family extracellular repeat protein
MSPRIPVFLFVSSFVLVSCRTNETDTLLSPGPMPLDPQSNSPRIMDLGTLGGLGSNAQAVNESGVVVGWSPITSGELHGFMWTEGEGMRDLGQGRALKVNDEGVVLLRRPDGYALWSASGTRPTGLSLAYSVSDMNNHGVLVGQTSDSRAFVWSAESGVTFLSSLGRGWSAAYAVNDHGVIAGYAATDLWHGPFLWDAATGPTAIPFLPGAVTTLPVDINEAGQVAGVAYYPRAYRAFRWSSTEGFVDVGAGMPASIDRSGNIIGTAESKNGGWSYAFYWTPATGMTNLHWLAQRPLSSFGHDMNDSGMIVGQSARFDVRKTGAQGHATLWRVR